MCHTLGRNHEPAKHDGPRHDAPGYGANEQNDSRSGSLSSLDFPAHSVDAAPLDLDLCNVQMAQMSQQAANVSPEFLQQGMNRFNNMSKADKDRAAQKLKETDPSSYTSMANQATAHLSAQQRQSLQTANQLKQEGNQLHAAKDYHRAADCYTRAKSALAGQNPCNHS